MIAALLLALVPGLTVTLPGEVHVKGTELRLADVAAIAGGAPAEIERLGALSLGYAPSPGYSRVIEAGRVGALIAQKFPGLSAQLAGASACRVWPCEERIGAQTLVASAREELVRVLVGLEAAYELEDEPREIAVPLGATPAKLRARLESAPQSSGSLSIPVEVLVDGLPYRTVYTSWRVRLWQSLPVLSRAVRAGEAIDASMMETRRVEVASAPRLGVLPVQALAGTLAIRDLASGSCVTALDVHRPTVVKNGDAVTLRVRMGAVVAQVKAIVGEAGAVGDSVRVKAETGRELSAVVLSASLVEYSMVTSR